MGKLILNEVKKIAQGQIALFAQLQDYLDINILS